MMLPDKQELLTQLKRRVGITIYQRGVAYFQMGAVTEIDAAIGARENDIIVSGEVAGSGDYQTELVFDVDQKRFHSFACSCPYEADCKHAVSLGIAFIEMYVDCVEDYMKLRNIPSTREVVDWITMNDPPSVVVFRKHRSFSERAQRTPKKSCKLSDYYIKLDTHYNRCTLTLFHKDNSWQQASPTKLLKNVKDLTETQRELLTLLKTTSSDHFLAPEPDYYRMWQLLKDGGIPVYRSDYGYWQRSNVNQVVFETNPSLLKAELLCEEFYNEYYDYTKRTFIFKLDSTYVNRKQSFYFNKTHIFHLDNTRAKVYEVAPYLMRLVRTAIAEADHYRYHRKELNEVILRAQLTDNEIIKLNRIIKDAGTYFDLQTTLTQDFKIQEFKDAQTVIEVDYNAKKGDLHIKPKIDYGCWHADVSETVFMSKRKGRQTINRRQDYFHPGTHIIVFDGKHIKYARIRQKAEKQLFQGLYQKFGFSKTLKLKRRGNKSVFEFYQTHWPELQKYCQRHGYEVRVLQDELNFISADFKADFNIDLNAPNDWLGFDVACYCGENQLTIEDVRLFIEKGLDFMQLQDGRLLQITNRKELERFVMMLESFELREQGGFEGRLYHAPELEYVVTSSKHYNAKLKKSFTAFLREAQSGKPVKKVILPVRFQTILRDYQKQGIDWFYFLRKYHFAGILADDMGLGKTIQTLILLELETVKNKPSLVVCPKTLLYNWQAEAKKFTPRLQTVVIDGLPAERHKLIAKAKQYNLLITGYATLKKDEELYKQQKIIFNYAILDEAQFIKNHATKNAQIVKKINADYRLALTGTPLENSVSEIWSIFDFLMPGFLGSYASFAKKFYGPIMKHGDRAALAALKKKIECFMLRRTKQDVLKELPPKIEQISHCHLGKAQNVLYQEVLTRVKGEVFQAVQKKGFDKARIHVLAGLTKLRQVCNHPVLLLKDKKYTTYESSKLEMFQELIEEITNNRKKVLVFSQFTQMLDILSKELKRQKIGYAYLSGKTQKRQQVVDQFNTDDGAPVFLISLKAGGTGLNLTSADHVIIFDPWWNPSVENQAVDRAHRIGQTNPVNVYRLITSGTIEEKIMALQEKKKYLFDAIVGESKDIFKKLTWDDVKALFE